MKTMLRTEAICMFLVLVIICIIAITNFAGAEYDFEERVYSVKYGDCLWDIAEMYCPNSMNAWDYICLVMERNNLEGTDIYPGQRLVVYKVRA